MEIGNVLLSARRRAVGRWTGLEQIGDKQLVNVLLVNPSGQEGPIHVTSPKRVGTFLNSLKLDISERGIHRSMQTSMQTYASCRTLELHAVLLTEASMPKPIQRSGVSWPVRVRSIHLGPEVEGWKRRIFLLTQNGSS